MATSIFELFGTIMVDNTKADESITKTEKKANSLAESFGNGVKKVAKFGAGVAAAATGAVTAITGMASSAASSMDEIDKASQKMGISAEGYQEWQHAMDLSGMSIDTMTSGMRALQKAMTGVDEEGNTTSEEFEKLGITLTNADGSLRSTEDVLNETILALADMGEGAERTTIATKLFGRAGSEMAPMLNSGKEAIEGMKQEAHDLGLVMSDEDVKAGAELNDTLNNLKASLVAMGTRLGTSVMPVVQKFADLLMTYMPRIQELFDRISPILTEMFDKLMPPLFDLVDAIMPVIFDILEALMPLFTQLAETILPIFTDLISKLAPILGQIAERIMPLLSQLLEAVIPIIDAIWPLVSTLLDLALSLIDPLLKLVETLLPPIIKLVQSLTPIIELLGQILTPIVELINAVLAPVLDLIITLLAPLTSALQILNPILEVLNSILKPILDVINLILKPVLDFVNWIFGDITSGVGDVNNSLGEGGLLGSLGSVSSFITGDMSNAFGTLGDLLGAATTVIGGALHGIVAFIDDPKQAFSDFFDWIGNKVQSAKNLISDVADTISASKKANSRTEYMAELQAKIASGEINVNAADYGEKAAALRKKYGLAEGAVLEPNKPFWAVVGDQTQGVNVEAPLDTIKQAVREELEQIVVNVMINVLNDTDRTYEVMKEKSWVERKRTQTEQFG